MTIRYVNTGTGPNAGNGDSLRSAFNKINQNFTELIESGLAADQALNTNSSVTFSSATITNILSIGGTIVSTDNNDIVINPGGTGVVEVISPMVVLVGDTVVNGVLYQGVQRLEEMSTASVSLTAIQIQGNILTGEPLLSDRNLILPVGDESLAGAVLTIRNRSEEYTITVLDAALEIISDINTGSNITISCDGYSWFRSAAEFGGSYNDLTDKPFIPAAADQALNTGSSVTFKNINIVSTATVNHLVVTDDLQVGIFQGYDDVSIIKDSSDYLNLTLRNTNTSSGVQVNLVDIIGGGLTIYHQNQTGAFVQFPAGHNFIFGESSNETLHIGRAHVLNFYADQNWGSYTTSIPSISITSGTGAVIFNKEIVISSSTEFTGHLIPSVDLTYDLGSTSSQWRSLYVSTSTVYFGGIPLRITADGGITVNNVPVSGDGGNQLVSDQNNNTLSITTSGDVVFSGEIGGVNRGLVWDYGAVAGGVNSMVRQDQNGLTVRAWSEGGPEPFSAPVNIVTNQDADQNTWSFDGNGVLTLPVGGDIVDSEGNSVLGSGTDDNNIWVETFTSDAPVTDQVQIATGVEYDANGNIFALFNHYLNDPPNTSTTYTSVAKLSPAGSVLWQVRFSANLNTDGWGLAYDGSDSVYVSGSTSDTPFDPDFATLTKIDAADGSIVWNKTYDFEASSRSAVVDVDSDDNPIMVGYASNGTDNYIITTKVDAADGSVIWSKTLDGQGDDEAYGMAVGPTGEVVTIGWTDTFGLQDTVATVVAEPVSNVNWTNERPVFNGGFSCTVSFPNSDGVPSFSNIEDTIGNRAIGDTLATILGSNLGDNGVDGTDDMVIKVATLAANDTDDRMIVVKYSSTGTIAWQKAVQFDANYDCKGADADIDSAGNIYVCGSYDTPIGSAMNLVKFDSAGVKQWSRRVVGDCADFASSVVVGPDNNLYLSGVTASPNAENVNWVVAKYSITGSVVWQRLIENTASWTFTGGLFFGGGGGSNIAVGTDYVALGGGFGNLANNEAPTATVVQIDTNGTPFSIGDWAVTAAQFTGNLDNTASDIVVVNADKTAGTATPTVADFVVEEDATNFLTGTLYTAPGGNDSLVNGAYSVSLGNTGTVTLPAGGTITEGYVTSNPTIQLTPASPDVASQKLVIKGGGAYNANDNGIGLNWYIINPVVNDTVEIYVNSPDNASQTLYWWIYPEGAGIATPESGTVLLNSGGSGNFSFTVDSDDYEFTVRVSPEANNYDPANTGVETQLFNSSAPTFDADHHLHLTTGDLAETSIFLGTDNHNVRTTVNGGIEITTPDNDITNVWRFDNAGILTVPRDGIIQSVDNNGRLRSQLRLDEGSDITRLSAWSSPDSVLFSASDWTTGTYTNNNGAGVIEFTGAENIINWLNANNYADRFFFSVNGGPQMANEGYGGGVSDITFNVATPPVTGTNTVTSFSIYYQFESRLDIDTDDQEFYILSTDNDLYLETRQSGNIQIRSVDSLDIVGDGIVTLRNNSATNGIEIRTDDGGHSWNFGVDGTTTFPSNKIKTPISSNISIETESLPTDPPATIVISGADFTAVNLTYIKDGANSIWYPAGYIPGTDPYIEFTGGRYEIIVPGFNQAIYVNTGTLNIPLAQWNTNPPLGSVAPTGVYTYPGTYTRAWTFGDDGILTFPDGTTNSGDTVIAPDVYNIQSIGNTLIQTSANAGAKTWTFGTDGKLTFPGAVVKSTVARTSFSTPVTLGDSTYLAAIVDGSYGPFTRGEVVFTVVVTSGVAAYTITSFNTSRNYTLNEVIGTLDAGDLGGTPGNTSNIAVASVTPSIVALDLTKTVNKLTTGQYTLANGVEGQIMYLVPQNGTDGGNVSVSVANSRITGVAYTGSTLLPFRIYNGVDVMDSTGICTLIFTDGAWQQQGGAWD